jgi:predicted nucleic acid-binding protein
MRVLFDTDVVLDLILMRTGLAPDAVALFQANASGTLQAHICAITPTNVFYIARKALGQAQTMRAIEQLLQAVAVCPVGASVYRQALALPMNDFEDATQIACAIEAKLDAIVTRNLSDYQASPLPVFSPAQMLARLSQP